MLLALAWLAAGCPIVYGVQAWRAWLRAGPPDRARRAYLAWLFAPFLLAVSISGALTARNAALVGSIVEEPPGEVAAAIEGLESLGILCDLSEMRERWVETRGTERSRRIAAAWKELRGGWAIDDDSGPRR